MAKPILLLDFDGVCHSYTSGWQGADVIPDPPVPGLWEFLAAAQEHFDVQIYSSRTLQPGGVSAMEVWFVTRAVEAGVRPPILKFPTEKPPAFLTIDDRAICFDGTWPEPQELLKFQPWNKRSI